MPGRTESLKGTGTCSSQLPGGALLVEIPGLACVDSLAAVIFAFSFLHPIAGSQGDSPGEPSETPPSAAVFRAPEPLSTTLTFTP